MALSNIRVNPNRPEDTRALDHWGREWCDRNGYSDAPDYIAGTVARTFALDTRKQAVDEMHELCKPYLHPSRVPRTDPSFKSEEPAVLPPAEHEPLTERLELRLGDGELEGWRAHAQRTGKSLSFLVRRAMRDDVAYEQAEESKRGRR